MNEDKERERRKRENKRRTNELRQTIRTHYYIIMLKIVTVLGHERLLLHFLYTIPQFLYTGDLQSFYN